MFRSKNREETPSQRLVPILIAETVESRTALSGQELPLPVLPFRVGHEDRHLSTIAATYLDPKERRNPGRNPNNDLYLPESGGQKYISRQHFLIQRDSKGRYFVFDRGSTLGTLVGGEGSGEGKNGGRSI